MPPSTARAYREASDERKAHALSAFSLALRSRDEVADEFMAVMAAAAREAEDRGLTAEILERLLNEDPAGDSPGAG